MEEKRTLSEMHAERLSDIVHIEKTTSKSESYDRILGSHFVSTGVNMKVKLIYGWVQLPIG